MRVNLIYITGDEEKNSHCQDNIGLSCLRFNLSLQMN